jgi:hypothetical protein
MLKSILATGAAAITLTAPAMAQVTSVSQLSDVQPTSWSYQALSNLISQYGCVAGYPGGTFKPGQPATRAELASLVDACLSRITEYQNAEDARLAAALKEQAAQWKGTQAAVAELQLAAAQKAQGVGNYVGLAVNLNRQGVNGGGYGVTKTVSGANLQVRYAAKTFSNQNAVSVRPYLNAAAGPNGNIGTAGGALVSYDVSIAKGASGVSSANLYAGAGYQIPFVNNSEANAQAAIGNRGQFVLALGAEAKVTKSLIGYSQLTFPTINTAPGTPYSPVYSAGLGIKF